MKWRMKGKCDDCPFMTYGKGLRVRKSLRSWRWPAILKCLRNDGHFYCHKTTKHDDDEEGKLQQGAFDGQLLCAGAISWQAKRKLSSWAYRFYRDLLGPSD